MLHALSPLDGRYQNAVLPLTPYFSEYGLIKYRVFVELEYLKALIRKPLPQLSSLGSDAEHIIDSINEYFNAEEAARVKEIESVTNHDVKAVEYYIKEKLRSTHLQPYLEFVHFGLTSQDINNTAFPLMLRNALVNEMMPALNQILQVIEEKAVEYKGIPMLARTHGQPASPTTLGKEMAVFLERLQVEKKNLSSIVLQCKFGGATGNLNAHKVAYPNIDWIAFADQFSSSLGLQRAHYTTQIAHYDDLAAVFQNWCRINTILIDFCRDMWTYISMEYFHQKIKQGEIGSSAMPHKVNPIDFENAEGNLGMANAIFNHLAEKLPVSRLQRDLTDSTVIRNIGVPFGHTLIALKAVGKGVHKLLLNEEKLAADLEMNWAVVSEAIQCILRREMYPEPYEALKELTRGKAHISKDDIHQFIQTLQVTQEVKEELLAITPNNYTGYF